MAGATRTLSHVWLPVAQGPGNASAVVQTHPGQYIIHTSVSPAAIVGDGFPAYTGKPEHLTLASGQFMHMRGRGEAYIEADTLV